MLVQHWALDRWHCIASDYLLGCIVVSTITDISLSTDEYTRITKVINTACWALIDANEEGLAEELGEVLGLLEDGEVVQ